MSQENVERLRQAYQAWHRGDAKAVEAAWREHLDPDFEFVSVLDGRVHQGPQGMRTYFFEAREIWKQYESNTEEIIDLGERAIVVGRVVARGAGSGVPVAQQLATVWTFRGDKAVHAEAFASRAEALEAMGLRE